MDFFLWVIERENAPHNIKLHVQALSKNEMKPAGVKRSIQALLQNCESKKPQPKISVQYFSKKKQFKVFVELSDCKQAQQFFARTFVMKKLAILDDCFQEVFEREMRVYLVKTEEEFTSFALAKYQEEIKGINAKSNSSRSNQRGNTQKTLASTKSLTSHTKLKDKLGEAQNNSHR